jgi:tRNA-2-methylthio-N6-dimethylallyladenosine synthase
MKYYLLVLGCQMNLSDSQRVRTVLESIGYEPTEKEENADLLGVVACSVRQKAIDKVYSRIHKWNSWKSRRNILTFASGCILPADRKKLQKRFDLLFSIDDLPELPNFIRQYGVVTPMSANPPSRGIHTAHWKVPATPESVFEAFVPIQNGCDKFCTFCAVPYTRGREISRSSDDIIGEVADLVEAGYRSITLLGQNVNSYGLDRRSQEVGFSELLRRIGALAEESGKEFWVYFTSPHPRDMGDDVIDAMADYQCLAKQVHLPLQSGDDEVLRRMNRGYGLDDYRRVVDRIRSTLPGATLFTDIIVGFAGETATQFEATRSAMREFQYNMAYIAMYSPRPGAKSSRWADDIPIEEKKRRLHRLSDELQLSSGEYNRRLIGRKLRVLVEGRDRKEGYLSGKTEGRLITRFPWPDDSLIGRFVDLEITDSAALSLEGRVESNPCE